MRARRRLAVTAAAGLAAAGGLPVLLAGGSAAGPPAPLDAAVAVGEDAPGRPARVAGAAAVGPATADAAREGREARSSGEAGGAREARSSGEAGAAREARSSGAAGAARAPRTGALIDARIADGTMAVAALRSTPVRTAPGGPTLAKLPPRAATGRPVRVAVAARRAGWVGVRLPERDNDELGWVREADVRWVPLRTRVDVDLSARRLLLRRDGKVVLRVRVAVGAPGNPTPTGRFGVTDRLRPAPGGPYGCCILALSGHQTKLPPGWPGGDRLAIHGTTNEATIGGAVSSGCLRARRSDLRELMRRVPVGATVVVRA